MTHIPDSPWVQFDWMLEQLQFAEKQKLTDIVLLIEKQAEERSIAQQLAESPQKEHLDRTFNEIKDAQERSSHIVYSPEPAEREWEEEFDRDFPISRTDDEIVEKGFRVVSERLKSFINRLLTQKAQEERERVLEMIEGMRKELPENLDPYDPADTHDAGYNTALSDLRDRITKSK